MTSMAMSKVTPAGLVKSAAALKCALLISVVLLLAGCSRIDYVHLEPFVADIDGKSELAVSTYPADFPKTRSKVPFLYRHSVTKSEHFFQVFIRDGKKKTGNNPHVDSIRIHSFSYRIDDQSEVELLANYDSNFWMQGNPKYNEQYQDDYAVAVDECSTVTVYVSFTLNGEDFEFEGMMTSDAKKRWTPLLFRALQ